MRSMADQAPPRAMGRPEMAVPRSRYGDSSSHTQPIDSSNSSKAKPRSLSPLPIPCRPRDMRRELGGRFQSNQKFQQDHYHDPKYPTQSDAMREYTGNSRPTGRDTAQQYQVPVTSDTPKERLETREDPWEFLFGSKNYVTLAPGDEHQLGGRTRQYLFVEAAVNCRR
jgi:hypothetical protein